VDQLTRKSWATATVKLVLECLKKGTGNITGQNESATDMKCRESIIRAFRDELKQVRALEAKQSNPYSEVEVILLRAALAMSMQVGNCHEHACTAFDHLWHKNYHLLDALDIMAAPMVGATSAEGEGDQHVFLVMGCPSPVTKDDTLNGFLDKMAETTGYKDEIVICDSWFYLRQVSVDGPHHEGVYTPEEYRLRTATKKGRTRPFLIDNVRSLFRIAPS
jgi:hypothetical protein